MSSFVCRLCLTPCSDRYKEIEKIDQKQFQIVLPEIDLAAVNSSLICIHCTTMLQTAYIFKSGCLETEKRLQLHIQTVGRENLNLADIIKYHSTTNDTFIEVEKVFVKIENNDEIIDNETCDDGYKESIDSLENRSWLKCTICAAYCENTHWNDHISSHLNVKKEMDDTVKKHFDLYSNKNASQFVCEVCKQSYKNLETLIEHIKSHFELPNEFKCQFCIKVFLSKDTLAVHLKTHFQRPLCKICNKSFTKLTSLTQHLTVVHNVTETTNIEFCDYETDEKSIKDALRKYPDTSDPVDIKLSETDFRVTSKKGRPYKCKLCPKSYLRRSHLSLHVSSHRGHPKCTICCKVFMRLQSYKLHMAKIHKTIIGANSRDLENITMLPARESVDTTVNSLYRCDICGKILQSRRSFMHHKLTHIRNKTCPYCNLECASTAGLTNHIDGVHLRKRKVNSEPKPRPSYTCEICGVTIKTKQSLQVHMRIHTGEQPFKCDLCGRAFNQNSSLRVHKRTIHSNEFPFSCEECNKRFKLRASLKKHICRAVIPVTLEKKFECTQCDKKFKQAHALKLHVDRTHNGNKNHSSSSVDNKNQYCDICGKGFYDRSTMIRHKKTTHFKETKFNCETCGKGFYQSNTFKEHMAVHRKIEFKLHTSQTHNRNKKHTCDICGKNFYDRSTMRRHKNNIHISRK